MRFFPKCHIGFTIVAFCVCLQGQNTPAQEAPNEIKGIPPRAAATDYQAQGRAGTVTIGAEFKGHSIPTAEGTLTSEDYVAVETALFGPAGARLTLGVEDFSLRLNGKKTTLPGLPYGMVVGSVKDPEWEPPASASSKSKTSVNGGGKEPGEGPPPPVKVPVEVRRAMAQRVQKAALAEGDRPLPQAGLIFFQYRGKTQNLHSIELIYAGPAGKATLALQP